jgi:hypothetical protein
VQLIPAGPHSIRLRLRDSGRSEIPFLAVPLVLAAAVVGYSRIRGRVHYPSDVLVGAAISVAAGLATQPVSTPVTRIEERIIAESSPAPPRRRRAVLVASPHAGRVAREMDRTRRALIVSGAEIVEELTVEAVDQVPDAVRRHDASVVIAAGGDARSARWRTSSQTRTLFVWSCHLGPPPTSPARSVFQ